jgi:hypothetical protein
MDQTEHKTITIFADNFQFHLQDRRSECDYPESWNEEIMNGLFVAGQNVVGIGTVRDLDVEVEIVTHSLPMDDNDKDKLPDLVDWDHAVQCSIEVPSGQLLLAGPTADIDHSPVLQLKPGRWGLRIFWANLEVIDEVGFEGEDKYKVELWPNTDLETLILKRWRSLAYYDSSDLD